MADSLQDQLLKAGVADEKQARKARKQKKDKSKKARRGEAAPDETAQAARREQAEKAERDRQIEAKRQAKRRAKEIAAQVRQIVGTHRVDRAGGEAVYRFTQGTRIKEIRVTDAQRGQLARGELAVVALREGYELVPASVADRIRPLDESAVRVANPREPGDPEADDPYEDYPVPDDLMW